MKTQTIEDLFFDQIRDLHSVESQLMDSLPAPAALAGHPPLAAFITVHAAQTDSQKQLLDGLLARHGVERGTDKCEAMEGLISGGNAHLDGVNVPQTRDLMLVAHCLRIEYYEVAGYGIALRLAQGLDWREEAAALESILQDEIAAARGFQSMEPILFRIAREGGLN